jgi:hypothetical protein
VTDSFHVRDRGLLLTPGIGDLGVILRVGQPIELRRPDGSTVRTLIHSLEMLHAPNPIPNPFVLLRGMRAEDVPAGTEVWIEVDESE